MRKFKKIAALSLVLAIGSSLAACSGDITTTESTTEKEVTEATEEDTVEDTEETTADESAATAKADFSTDGKVLNIQCFDDSFASRLSTYYPGYEANDPNDVTAGGKIGDVEVNFVITPNADNEYQNKLDQLLPYNAEAAEDDRIDLFMLEDDYALKYVNTDLTLPVADLGIVDSELVNQYKYTKDMVTDHNGNMKGVAWEATPGALIYSRDAAIEILGSDDPDTVQEAVADWDTFNETAKRVADIGFSMTASTDDTLRVFLDNVSSPWVVDGKIVVDGNLKKWAVMTKEQVDANMTGTCDAWSDDWTAGFYPEGKVFCYFGPVWLVDSFMCDDDPLSIAGQGGWGIVEGPQNFTWGDTWMCAANGTDNPALVADIMRKFTVDTEMMTDFAKNDKKFVNNKSAMDVLAADKTYRDDALGGQNAFDILKECADKVDKINISEYDQGCIESFKAAMKDYFEGNTDSYEDALDAFYKSVTAKYPELTY